jgi:hypothetical protein
VCPLFPYFVTVVGTLNRMFYYVINLKLADPGEII